MNNLYILYEYVMDISDVIIYISVREFNPLSFSPTFFSPLGMSLDIKYISDGNSFGLDLGSHFLDIIYPKIFKLDMSLG